MTGKAWIGWQTWLITCVRHNGRGNNVGWSIGADVRGLFREDSGFSKQEVVGHCETCGEAVTLGELGNRQSECFHCWYGAYLRKDGKR